MSKKIPTKSKIISLKRTVAITDATFGNFLFNKKSGKIMIVPPNATANGYKNPDQKDSFQIRTLPIPRKIHNSNNIPQAIAVPCLVLDFLKS